MIRSMNFGIIGFVSVLVIGQLGAQLLGWEWMGSRKDQRPTVSSSGTGGTRGWFGRTGSGFGFGK
ncbi:MAG: hypothetical protein R3B96_05795 [Pirellulaceae bacterium]